MTGEAIWSWTVIALGSFRSDLPAPIAWAKRWNPDRVARWSSPSPAVCLQLLGKPHWPPSSFPGDKSSGAMGWVLALSDWRRAPVLHQRFHFWRHPLSYSLQVCRHEVGWKDKQRCRVNRAAHGSPPSSSHQSFFWCSPAPLFPGTPSFFPGHRITHNLCVSLWWQLPAHCGPWELRKETVSLQLLLGVSCMS
jgi:hypothetical protein